MSSPRLFSRQWWHKEGFFLLSVFGTGVAWQIAWIPGHDWLASSVWAGPAFLLSFLPVLIVICALTDYLRFLFSDWK